MNMKFKKSEVERVRQLMYVQDGNAFGNEYNKIYKGNKIPHVTLALKGNKYASVPTQLYLRAKRKQEGMKWKPMTENLDVELYNKDFKQDLYKGEFTLDEIRKFAQQKSNQLDAEGKIGLLSVAVLNYDSRGLYLSGKLREFGDRVELLDQYSGDDKAYGFAIYTLIRD